MIVLRHNKLFRFYPKGRSWKSESVVFRDTVRSNCENMQIVLWWLIKLHQNKATSNKICRKRTILKKRERKSRIKKAKGLQTGCCSGVIFLWSVKHFSKNNKTKQEKTKHFINFQWFESKIRQGGSCKPELLGFKGLVSEFPKLVKKGLKVVLTN